MFIFSEFFSSILVRKMLLFGHDPDAVLVFLILERLLHSVARKPRSCLCWTPL